MSDPVRFQRCRLILCHKQSTSARTLFLRHAAGNLCGPEPLPTLASWLEAAAQGAEDEHFHPAGVVRVLGEQLGIEHGELQPEAEFYEQVDTPDGPLHIFLGRFTSIDPPRQQMEQRGARFYAITELRGCHPAEMGLLRRAYEVMLGG